MSRVLLALLTANLLNFATAKAQTNQPCGSDDLHQKRMATDPAYQKQQQVFEKKYLELLQTAQKGAAGADFTLPVVVHIVHQNGAENISDALVEKGIQHLNESFANIGYYDNGNGLDTRIQFCLARQDPNGGLTNGIVRVENALTNMVMETEDVQLKNLSRWDPKRYVNIWLVREINSNASGSGVAGYAYFPGAHGSNVDGLVFEARWMGSSNANSCVATHEMGHYLGLYHTFQGGCTNADCSTDGDRVCDTPPDASTAAVACNGSANSCTTDTQSGFTTDQNDMFINYMDYGNWACYNAFTEGQRVRMEASILGARKSLLTSKGCIDPCTTPFGVSFTSSANNVAVGSTVNFTNTSLNGATWEWSVDGTTWTTNQNASYTFTTEGVFFIRLKSVGTNVLCEGEAFDSIKVFCPVKSDFQILTTTFLAGKNIPLNAVSTGGNQFSWTINGIQTSAVKFWNWVPPAAGFYNICLQTSNGFCTDDTCMSIEVKCDVDASISIWDQSPTVGQNVPVASSSANATTLNWTLNGSPYSTLSGFNLNLPTAGIYTLCLNASNGYCDDTDCIQIEAVAVPCPNPPCLEDCENGLDDDLDGLVDCYDVADCECTPIPDCAETDTLDSDFGVRLAWRNTKNLTSAIASPMVANLDPQNGPMPEIIVPEFITGSGGNQNPRKFYIFQGDGSNKDNPDVIDIPSGFNSYPVSVPCIADIDRDGKPEFIMVCWDSRIRVFRNFTRGATPSSMTTWIVSAQTAGDQNYHVYAADFDSDGITELYAGNEVYYFDFANPAAPTLQKAPVTNGHVGESNSGFARDNASSIAYDLLTRADCGGDPDCDGLEIAAGAYIYSVDVNNGGDGDPRQIKVQRNLNSMIGGQTFYDGYTAVADLDLNGIPEVVVAGARGSRVGIYVWNKTGFWSLFQNQGTSTSGSGTPCISNVFDDKTAGFTTDFPEVIMTNENWISCFNLHKAIQTPTAPYWWRLPTTDFSGYTGATTFDFNGDKIYEIVYRDEDSLRIMYGGAAPFPKGVSPERNWASFPAYSVTADEYPVIADVDADGQAEIVYTANPEPDPGDNRPYDGYVYVLESDEQKFGPWLSARNVWNQYSYFVTNINDDLTVPAVQQANHLELPKLGSGKRPLNQYLFQLSNFDKNFEPYLPLSDATLELTTGECIGNNQFLVKIQVCNVGDAGLQDSLPITFYKGGNPMNDPAAGKILTMRATGGGIQKDSCQSFELTLPLIEEKIWAVLNDAGNFAPPIPPDSAFFVTECDFLNNWDTLNFKNISPPLDLGPDIKICKSTVYEFNAGSGFKTYRWHDGSTDSTFTAWESGKYWVLVTDNCGNEKRDTVEILLDTIGTIELGEDRAFCNGSTQPIQLDVPGYTTYQWSPATGLSCTTCPNPIINPTGGKITYKVLAETQGGCSATDSIQITVADSVLLQVIGKACPNEKFTYAGHEVLAGDTEIFPGKTTAGCDSLTKIQVLELPTSQSNADLSICTGDSIMIFGEVKKAAGVFSKVFKNYVGCDSTATVNLSLLTTPAPTNEIRAICPGKTTQVFGQTVAAAGVFSKIFPAANGCDSTHTIEVQMHPQPQPTSEARKICSGDTTFVFGEVKTAAGVFSKIFQNADGCDSLHTISVELFATPQPTNELRKICAGDSTFIFGEVKKAAGVFSKIFQNANGCDSTHTISLEILQKSQPTSEARTICPGTTTQIFGQAVNAAGVFSKTFQNVNGCDSTHTISVTLHPQPVPTSEARQICPGDTTLVFGEKITTAGVFPKIFQNANGCDSTHTISVAMLAGSQPTSETRRICPGDTTFIDGVSVTAAGSFPKKFPNGSGCDSLHTIFVEMFAEPLPTDELRRICPGDSTVVFGEVKKAAGIFSRIFQNPNGCDSTHTVVVQVLPEPLPTSELRQICPGDETQVFGQTVAAAGVFSKIFQNSDGCDSTHTISVEVFAAPQPTSELRKICMGDSTLVFGEVKKAAGVFPKTFQNLNGCDSLHTIGVEMLPQPAPLISLKQPACEETAGNLTILNLANQEQWQLDGGQFQNATATPPAVLPGNHSLRVRNSDGCSAMLNFSISEPPPTHFRQDSVRICEGETIDVFGQNVSTAGVFQKVLMNQFGCDSTLSRVVAVTPAPDPALETVAPTCADTFGVATILNLPPDVRVSLDGSPFGQKTSFLKLKSGKHRLLFDREGCITEREFFFEKPAFPKVVLPADTLIELGNAVEIQPQISPANDYDFVWSPATWLNCTDCPASLASPLKRIEYQLVITDSLGCKASDRMVIKIVEPNIYVPNVFSPNGDNSNDGFTIYAGSAGVTRIVWMKVFDRWGNQVFENRNFQPNDERLGWDGNFRGQKMNPAVFVFEAEVELVGGELVFLKGDVALVR